MNVVVPRLVPGPPAASPRAPALRRLRPGFVWIALSSVAMAAILLSSYTGATLAELAQDDTGLASTYADRPTAVQVAFFSAIPAIPPRAGIRLPRQKASEPLKPPPRMTEPAPHGKLPP